MSEGAKILSMRPPMGWQIEYEIHCEKPPKDHPEVEISVSMEDSIHWFCRDKKFRVLSVHPDLERSPKAPTPLFYRPFPEDPEHPPEFAYHVNSGPARRGTEDNYYKPVFEFDDGTKLDPHIRTHK